MQTHTFDLADEEGLAHAGAAEEQEAVRHPVSTRVMRAAAVLALLAAVAALPLGKYELYEYNPVANVTATVVSGNARFTVLTPQVPMVEGGLCGRVCACVSVRAPCYCVYVHMCVSMRMYVRLCVSSCRVMLHFPPSSTPSSSVWSTPPAVPLRTAAPSPL